MFGIPGEIKGKLLEAELKREYRRVEALESIAATLKRIEEKLDEY